MIFKHTPLYRFLMFCNEENKGNKILDCGAGGATPPLSLFAEHDYATTGIEFDENQARIANEFGKSRNQNLNIHLGDMRALEFEDSSFDYVYSYNSVFHMKKEDIDRSILELKEYSSRAA